MNLNKILFICVSLLCKMVVAGEFGFNPPISTVYQWALAGKTNQNGINYYGNSFLNKDNEFVTPAGEGVTVAVLDTGYLPDPNYIGALLPTSPGSKTYGYTFLSDCRMRGDKNCPATYTGNPNVPPRADALDTGNFGTKSDCDALARSAYPILCMVRDSTWHGNQIINVIAGQGKNPHVWGGAFNVKIVPIRIMGKFSLNRDDFERGMLWAVNKFDTLINENPARVLSTSITYANIAPYS